MTEAYPLQWPNGKRRFANRQRSKFGERSIEQATQKLCNELRLMRGSSMVISTNLRLRNDGLPYSKQAQPGDTGVAVYFLRDKKQMCFACDRWDRIQDNIYAIAMTIEALRGIERWGTGDMVEQAFTGFVALPAPKNPYEILGVGPDASDDEIDAAYRLRAKSAHPDTGGSIAAMQELTEARAKLKSRAA